MYFATFDRNFSEFFKFILYYKRHGGSFCITTNSLIVVVDALLTGYSVIYRLFTADSWFDVRSTFFRIHGKIQTKTTVKREFTLFEYVM